MSRPVTPNLPVMTGVKVQNPQNPRDGQAGGWLGMVDGDPAHGTVRFDSDGQAVIEPIADLQVL